jgi:LytS/YehU family sensor histidine kinase
VEDIEDGFASGTFIGFGFVGLVLGSFVGWCTGLLSRVAGQTLLEYIVIGAAIGIWIGVISGYFIRTQLKSA